MKLAPDVQAWFSTRGMDKALLRSTRKARAELKLLVQLANAVGQLRHSSECSRYLSQGEPCYCHMKGLEAPYQRLVKRSKARR